MKKVLALTLSAVLAMGAATTAFAYRVTENGIGIGNDNDNEWQWDANGADDKMEWDTEYEFELAFGSDAQKLYYIQNETDDEIYAVYDAKHLDTKEDAIEDQNDKKQYSQPTELGTTAEDLYTLIDESKASLTVKVTDGKEYVETAKVEEDGGVMKLYLTTAQSVSTKDGKIAFELTLSDRGSRSKFTDVTTTIKDLKITAGVGKAEELGDAMNVKEDGVILDTDKMESTEDYEITWGDDEIARFVVDLDDNDGKKNLDYTTAPIDALIEANPEANMDFFTLKAAPRFNKIGEMTLYADGDVFKYLYEVDADGQLTEVNATYDEDEEGFVFKTRQLGSYVMSDIELVGAAIDEEVPGESDTTVPGESETTDDGRENPATGANDMVNVAAAMAVVSLAAAGAVAFKKSSK